MNWRRILGRLAALALLVLLLIWAFPRLKNLIRIVRLYREPPPESLPVPVQGIEPYQLADTWGAARSEGSTYEGIDIFALRGTPVIGCTHGVGVLKGLYRMRRGVVGVVGSASW